MTPAKRWLTFGLALLGLGFASTSAYVHYRLLTDPTYVSPCDINATFNCSQVYMSRFGSVKGVSVALGGVAWFALVALISGLSRPAQATAEVNEATSAYLFALATIGLAVILYLGYASFFILKTACILCLGTYVSVIGIFIVSGLSTSMSMMRLPMRLLSDVRKPRVLLGAVVYLAISATVFAVFPMEARQATVPQAPSSDLQKQFETAWAAQPRVDLGIPAGGAKIVLVKFNDWLCPGCKGFEVAYKPILDKYAKSNPGAIKYVRKDWPWSKSCNFNITQTFPGHEASCEAAAAVRMAADQGKGEQMGDWLFENQERIFELDRQGGSAGPNTVKSQVATMLGITDFDKAYAAKLPDLKRDIADGGVLQVHSTPTYFLNGVRLTDTNTSSNLPPEYLELAIQIELKKVAGGRGGGQ